MSMRDSSRRPGPKALLAVAAGSAAMLLAASPAMAQDTVAPS